MNIISELKKNVIKFLGRHNRIKVYIADPLIYAVGKAFWYNPRYDDQMCVQREYRKMYGEDIDFENPITFNEKSNWRKIFDRKPMYTQMVDKFRLKQIIDEKLGEQYHFKVLGVWKDPDDIDFDLLPDKFVLKCNHDGGVIICRDKKTFDKNYAIRELKKRLKNDYWLIYREWPYKDVERCVICEEYMGEDLVDYKVWCFNNEPRYIFVWKNIPRNDGRKPMTNFCGAYTFDWIVDERIKTKYPSSTESIARPKCLDDMYRCAKAMSKGTTFLRVDFFVVDDQPYIGETTFFPWGGYFKFESKEIDILLGNQLHLDINNKTI